MTACYMSRSDHFDAKTQPKLNFEVLASSDECFAKFRLVLPYIILIMAYNGSGSRPGQWLVGSTSMKPAGQPVTLK